jgi:hypothetical protein
MCACLEQWDFVPGNSILIVVVESLRCGHSRLPGAPSQFEAGFISSVHGRAVVEATIVAAEKAFERVR